jgi:predicted Zn-dependent protease
LLKPGDIKLSGARGEYAAEVRAPWESWPLAEKIEFLRLACLRLKRADAILDRRSSLGFRRLRSLLATSEGAHIVQEFSFRSSGLLASANRGSEMQRRSFGQYHSGQGGLECIDQDRFLEHAVRVGEEALKLLDAPNCPSGASDLLLMPEQMVLQIHESIGHPLELDRILGDERNYAGGSFVKPEMFGSYRYGSELLNVSFDPGRGDEYAAYRFDDEGTPALREMLIERGVLMRPLGGATSQRRANLPGVACTRACDWNRPPIDRMANVNLEPGESTMEDLIGSIERGILMDTNRSWSIDDQRNKFQFGCEIGRVIENGELKDIVKNPNYRGISSGFWRSLAGVGNAETFEVLGVPNCGKGEPNQMIHVGHAAPVCVFRSVDVFGA